VSDQDAVNYNCPHITLAIVGDCYTLVVLFLFFCPLVFHILEPIFAKLPHDMVSS